MVKHKSTSDSQIWGFFHCFFSLFPFLGSLDHTKPEEKSRVPYLFSASFGQRIPTTSRCYPVATAAWYLFLLRTEQEPELDEICFN
jgi:hypothetical protein